MRTILPTSVQLLLNNPVITLSCSAIAAAAIIALWSTSTLLSTLLYQPTLNISVQQASQATSQVDSSMIGQRNFFGFADAKPAIVIDELPETQLELTLSGVFTALKESNAGAIIVDDKNQSKHYAVGDSLPGNAVLKSIHKNKVVITRNGIFETLYFADLQKDNDGKPTGRAISISPDQAKERRQAIRDRINKLRNKKK